jgi:hypothetical protein
MSTQDKNLMAMSAYHSEDSDADVPGCTAPLHSQEEDVSSEAEDSNELACSMPLMQSEMTSSSNDKVSGIKLGWGSASDRDALLIRQPENVETSKWIGKFDFVHVKEILTVKGVEVYGKLKELEEKIDRVNQIVEYLNFEDGDFEEVDDSEDSDADSEVECSDDYDSEYDSSIEDNSSDDESQSYDSSEEDSAEDSDENSDQDSDEESDEESDSEYEMRPSFASEAHIVAAVLVFIVAYLYIFQGTM